MEKLASRPDLAALRLERKHVVAGVAITAARRLAINVFMLAHPIDAIRAWQAGG